MKKLLIIGIGFFAFACSDANNSETNTDATTTDESVEIGSGEEISPQLEGLEDTARLEVDTLSNTDQINQEQDNQRQQ